MNLFVFLYVRGFQQGFVDGATAFVIEFAVRDMHTVQFRFEHGSLHAG
jgi:hypothetical protein